MKGQRFPNNRKRPTSMTHWELSSTGNKEYELTIKIQGDDSYISPLKIALHKAGFKTIINNRYSSPELSSPVEFNLSSKEGCKDLERFLKLIFTHFNLQNSGNEIRKHLEKIGTPQETLDNIFNHDYEAAAERKYTQITNWYYDSKEYGYICHDEHPTVSVSIEEIRYPLLDNKAVIPAKPKPPQTFSLLVDVGSPIHPPGSPPISYKNCINIKRQLNQYGTKIDREKFATVTVTKQLTETLYSCADTETGKASYRSEFGEAVIHVALKGFPEGTKFELNKQPQKRGEQPQKKDEYLQKKDDISVTIRLPQVKKEQSWIEWLGFGTTPGSKSTNSGTVMTK